MADLESLYKALRNADAAGDTDAARTLAQYIQSAGGAPQPKAAPSTERSFTDVAKDIPAAAISGLGSLAQLPGQLYGLTTGDFKTGALQLGKDIQQYGEEMKSAGLKAREEARQQKIAEAEKTGQLSAFGTAISETLKDPALLTSFGLEQIPQLLIPAGAAGAVGRGVLKAGTAGLAEKGLTGAAAAAAEKEILNAAIAKGASAAVGAGSVQQGADIGAGAYEDLYRYLKEKGYTDEQAAAESINKARAAGAAGAVISLLAQRLPGAKALERALAGERTGAGRILGAGIGAVKETPGEILEETGGKFAQNVAQRAVDPTQSLTAGLGQTAGMAAVGGIGMGGIGGALGGGRRAEAPSEQEQPAGTEAPLTTQPVQPVGTPLAPAPAAKTTLTPDDENALINYTTGLPEEAGSFFQNRDRSGKGYIQQMQSVASGPDYSRLSVTKDFGTGSPVLISDINIPEAQMGRIDIATLSSGQRIPVQYAVVDANDVFASNTVSGQSRPEYGDLSVPGIRAIAGNGRIAGLQQAYNTGTSTNYRSEFEADNQHGIDPTAIAGIQNPVLVRIMPKSFVTSDIADISNVSGIADLPPIDAAKNDLKRMQGKFDIAGLTFTEDGRPTDAALQQFISAMPLAARNNLINQQTGQPNPIAVQRLMNAIFFQAYNNDSLIDLYADTDKPEAKIYLNALAQSAPKMAALANAGEYDIRPQVVEAVQGIVNAVRSGIPIKELPAYVKQGEIGRDPYAQKVMEMFAESGRSSKRISEGLNNLATRAAEQANAGVDMFGEKPKASLDDIFGVLTQPLETEPDLFDPDEKTPDAVQKPVEEEKPENKNFEIDKPLEQIAKEVQGMKIPQLGKWAVDNAPNSAAKEIATKVLARLKEFDKLKVFPKAIRVLNDSQFNTKGVRGAVTLASMRGVGIELTLRLNGLQNNKSSNKTGTRYVTILHELTHAATTLQINYSGPNNKAVNDLKVLYNVIKKKVAEDIKLGVKHPALDRIKAGSNTMQHADELLAWGFTDNDFQDYLSKIKIGNRNGFSKLVEIVRKLFGISENSESALEAVMRTGESLLDAPLSQIQTDSAASGRPLKPFKETVGKAVETTTKENRVADAANKLVNIAQGAMQKNKPLDTSARPDLDPKFVAALNPVFKPQTQTIINKVNSLKGDFFKRLAQGVADQYRAIKDYSEVAYMQARMSKSVDGALEGLLMNGQVFDDGGALNIKKDTKGLLQAMKPVGAEVDYYMMWVALNREASLPMEKRSPNMADLLDQRNQLSQGTLDGKPRIEVYQQVQRDMNALNKSVLDIALAKGLINSSKQDIAALQARNDLDPKEKQERINKLIKNPGAYERFSNDIWYVPFYKAMEDGDIQSASTAGGLTGQKFSAELKGSNKAMGDLVENTLLNWSHILSAAMKNQASNSTVDAAMTHGAVVPNLKAGFAWDENTNQVISAETGEVIADGKLRPEYTEAGKGMVKVMRDGQPMYFEVYDPMLLDSITSIGYLGPKGVFIDVARDFKNILQYGVTISPAFKVRNLFRDSISALAVTPLKKNPFANVIEGWIASDKNNPAHIAALAGGGIFNFGSTYEGDQAKLIRRLLESGVDESTILDTPAKVKEGLKKAFDKYQEWGNKSEAANRMALYNQLIKAGKSHLEASFAARDMLDFSMQGSWPAFRMVTQVVPFMNARIQGLYKLGRDGVLPTSRVLYNTVTGKPLDQSDKQKAASFGVTSLAVAMASMALYMAFKDDDDFKQRDEWDRDNFWWFKLPGMDYAFRVPKPFEIGALGTIAERTLEQIIDEDAEGKQFESSIKRMLGDTFAMNPTPQFIKPLIDLYANKDSFTGSPIESAGMERLSKQERMTDTTSPLAQAVAYTTQAFGEKGELSPVQVEYAIKAYFGWLGGTVAETSHYATMPFREGAYPDAKLMDRVSVGFIKELPSNQSRYVNAFYESNKQISQAYADMRHFSEANEMDKVIEIMEEKGDLIALQKIYDHTAKSMANVRKQIKIIMNDTSMDGAEKREEIDRLKGIISMYAQQAEDVRKSLK
jgi:hypothetical protein